MPQRGLSAHTLKIIAIIAMTIDHIAWAFVDACSAAGILMHLVGPYPQRQPLCAAAACFRADFLVPVHFL